MATNDPQGVVTLRCGEDVDRLLRRAVSRIEALGLDVFEVIDHSGDAADAGLTVPDTKLVVFADAAAAGELMLAHPHIAIDLPLKLLIREGRDGDVFISYNAPAFLARRYGLTDREAGGLQVVETIARDTHLGR